LLFDFVFALLIGSPPKFFNIGASWPISQEAHAHATQAWYDLPVRTQLAR
jgi:hypothetical protein